MNETNFAAFSQAYRAGLEAAVAANPGEYFLDGSTPAQFAEIVSARMLKAIAEKPMGVNYNGGGFQRACKALGIKPTRKAILAYLEIA